MRLPYHPATLATYLGLAQRAALHETIAGLGGRRDLAWVFLEAAGLMAGPGGVAAITEEDARDQRALTLGVVVFRSGRRSEHVLAQTDAYGRWIRWLDPETAAHA